MQDFLVRKAYAASASSATFNTYLNKILDNIVTPVIYLLVALAVAYFLWGVMVFIQNADNATEREKGYKHMIWGIIGIFIMISAKGIIGIITATLGGF